MRQLAHSLQHPTNGLISPHNPNMAYVTSHHSSDSFGLFYAIITSGLTSCKAVVVFK